MKLIRVLALMLLVLAGATARAADEPAATVPNPATLPGDWWTYFEPKEPIDDETLQKRVIAANSWPGSCVAPDRRRKPKTPPPSRAT